MAKKTDKTITEESQEIINERTKLLELKKELNDYIRTYATTKTVSYGGVLEVLRDMARDMELLMQQNIMKQIAMTVYQQMSEVKNE